MYRGLAKEPWLLATSDKQLTSQQIVGLYAKRMQIEQNFRDDKSQQSGFSWRFSRTSGVKRMSMLCLIACLATTALWLIGHEAERRQWHHQFQANTIKTRRVLSFLTLAKQVIKHVRRRLTHRYLKLSVSHFILNYKKYAVL